MKGFKKDQKVRCLKNCGDQFTKGKIYTVRQNQTSGIVMVYADDKGENNGWGEENFEPGHVSRFAVRSQNNMFAGISGTFDSIEQAREALEKFAENEDNQMLITPVTIWQSVEDYSVGTKEVKVVVETKKILVRSD